MNLRVSVILLKISAAIFLLACLFIIPFQNTLAGEETLDITMWMQYPDSQVKIDDEVIYEDAGFSYHLSSVQPNDLRLHLVYPVEKETFYQAEAWVRTASVRNEEKESDQMGAGIEVGDGNISDTLLGSNEWTKVSVPFYSGSRESIKISLFLGYYYNTCVGECWMTPPVLTKVTEEDEAPVWRLLFVIPRRMNVTGGEGYSCVTDLSSEELSMLLDGFEAVKNALNRYGEGIFQTEYQALILNEPYTQPFHQDQYGYSISAKQAHEYLNENGVHIGEYDHIFLVYCMEGVPSDDVFGLGGPSIQGKIKYSSVEFDYHSHIHSWFEHEKTYIFIHEFLHGIEYLCRDQYGLAVPDLHEWERYGYSDELEWYRDYLRCEVKNCDSTFPGIPAEAWKIKPSSLLPRNE